MSTRPVDATAAQTDGNGFWQPDVTVATLVPRGGKLLFVEERVRGDLVINQPAGHLEPDESLVEAAIRETLEETAWEVAPTALVGLYQWQAPETGRHYLRVAIAADPLRHDPSRVLDEGIVRALWLSPTELAAVSDRHRSPLVARVVEDYLAGRRLPLAALNQVP